MYFISKLYQLIQYQQQEYHHIIKVKHKENEKKHVYTILDTIKIVNPINTISKNTLKQY
jgi:hypothetical protein